MLGAVRRQGLAQALRACAPRSIPSRATLQLVKCQRPSAISPLTTFRALHSSPAFRYAATGSGAAAQAQAQANESALSGEERITLFQELADQDLVSSKIIYNITKKMNITTMTDVQSMTINETLKGDDVYVLVFSFPVSV